MKKKTLKKLDPKQQAVIINDLTTCISDLMEHLRDLGMSSFLVVADPYVSARVVKTCRKDDMEDFKILMAAVTLETSRALSPMLFSAVEKKYIRSRRVKEKVS